MKCIFRIAIKAFRYLLLTLRSRWLAARTLVDLVRAWQKEQDIRDGLRCPVCECMKSPLARCQVCEKGAQE